MIALCTVRVARRGDVGAAAAGPRRGAVAGVVVERSSQNQRFQGKNGTFGYVSEFFIFATAVA